MAFVDDRARPELSHRIMLEEREQLVISGVEEVESFDESTIYLTTAQGALEIQGDELHIEKLSLDGGELHVDGRIDSISYEEQGGGRAGWFGRLFG